MSKEKKEKDPVRDLKPSTDAKGGRHGHHHGGHQHLRIDKGAGQEDRGPDKGLPYL
jgi:hypothetical protein